MKDRETEEPNISVTYMAKDGCKVLLAQVNEALRHVNHPPDMEKLNGFKEYLTEYMKCVENISEEVCAGDFRQLFVLTADEMRKKGILDE